MRRVIAGARDRLIALLRRTAIPLMAALVLLLLPAAVQAAPMTYTVTKFTDSADSTCDADCSLREAIIAANANSGHDTIILPPGTYSLSIDGAEGPDSRVETTVKDLDIVDGVSITGAGGNRDGDPNLTIIQVTVVAPAPLFRAFDIELDNVAKPGTDMSVKIEALTIRNAAQPIATGLHNGGGLQFSSTNGPGNLLIYNSIFTGNRAASDGGAISAANPNGAAGALLRIEKSALINNVAGETSFGGIGGSGGAILVGDKLPVQIVDSRISNNTSHAWSDPATKLSTGQGGAIYWWDNGPITSPASYIHNTIMDSNHAVGPTYAGGGAMYVGRSLEILNSTISNNIAEHDGGGLVTSSIDGHTLTIANTTISGNKAHNDGGGLYVSHGGTTGPTINLINMTITNNRADNDNNSAGNGGGLRRQTSPANGQIRLHNSIIARNFVGSSGTNADDMQGTGSLASTSSYNLVGAGGNGGLNPANNNLLNVADPRLGPLANNGSAALPPHVGARFTHALLGDSPALDAGSNTYLTGYGANLTTDGRGTGWARTLDAADAGTLDTVDIGALEMHPAVADSGNVTMLQDTSINNYTVHLGDADLGYDSFTAVSSNASILPNPGISGVGATRTLVLTPVAGQFGTVTVTLTTTDSYNGVSQSMTDTFTVTVVPRPNLTITKSHVNPWKQGDTGKTYTVTVSNLAGAGPTLAAGNAFGIPATVTVADTLPAGLTATNISGTGWTCDLPTLTCTRSDILAAGAAYPVITVTVTVADAADPSVTNNVTVSGNADNTPGNNSVPDLTPIVQTPDLTVAKSHSGNFQQGQLGATYTLTLNNGGTNTGPTSGAYSVTETLPTGITFVSGTSADAGWSCSAAGQDVTCTRSTALASPGSTAITITVNVARDAGTPFDTTASVSGGGEVGSRLTNNTSNADPIIVTPMPDLTVALAEVGTFRQGQSADYTVTVTNSGFAPTDGTDASVTVTLPAGLTATAMTGGASWTCTVATSTCTSADVIAGGGTEYPAITLTVQVADTAATSVVTTASVAATSGGQLWTANDSASKTTTVIKAPDLAIAKSHTGDFTQGQTGATYSLVVSNKAGAGPTSGLVTVADTLPNGLTPVGNGGAGTGWSCAAASQTVTCTRSDVVAAGGNYPGITLTVDVAAGALPSVTNTATVSGGTETGSTLTDNSSSNPTTIIQLADLKLTKSDGGASFQQGQKNVTYTITVENIGTGSTGASPVTVTDTLPAGLSYVSGVGTGWSCTYDTGTRTVSCSPSGPVAPGASVTITLTVDVARNATAGTDALTNSATVSVAGDTDTANNSSTDTSTVVAMPDLEIAKAAGIFRQGQNAEYTLTVTNTGFAPTSGTVTVKDTLDASLTYVSGTGSDWTCTYNSGTRELDCTTNAGVTAAASTAFSPLTVAVGVGATAPATLTNTATVDGGGQIWIDSNDSATISHAVVPGADLKLIKSYAGEWQQGESGKDYTLKVSNTGAGPTFGTVTVTDGLDGFLTYVNATGTDWACNYAGWTVTCTYNKEVVAGADFPAITLTVDVATNAPANVLNTASVSGGNDLGATPADNTSTANTAITQLADLEIAKNAPDSLGQGQRNAVYLIMVENIGTGTTGANPVTVTDVLAADLTYVGAVGSTADASGPTPWTCGYTPGTRTVSCSPTNEIRAGRSAQIAVTVDVARDAAAGTDVLANTANVSAAGDTDTANNSSTVTTTVVAMPDLEITKTAGTFHQGQNADYTLTVTNTGFAPTSGTVTVKDTLDPTLTYVSGTGTGWTCTYDSGTREAACTTNAGVTAAASTAFSPITLTVGVGSGAPGTLDNTATVEGGGQIWVDSKDSSSVNHIVIPGADLKVIKSYSGVWTQGETNREYTIEVSNTGAGPTFGDMTVTDVLDANLTYVSGSGIDWTCTYDNASRTVTCAYSKEVLGGVAFPAVTLTVDVAATAPPTVDNTASVSGGNDLGATPADNTSTVHTALAQLPDLTIAKSHPGDFTQGQTGAEYRLVVTNSGTGLTSGTVTVTDTLPASLTPKTATAAADWDCTVSGQDVTCTTDVVKEHDQSYSPITITVDVDPLAPIAVTNTAAVAGGSDTDTGNNTASDATTIIQAPDLTIAKSHTGTFQRGQKDAAYTITIGNGGGLPTSDTVTVTDTMPTGVTPKGWSGTDWTCAISGQTYTCTTGAVLAAGASYPALTLTVDVLSDAPAAITNTATVAGGGQVNTANDSASDATTVVPESDLSITKSHTGDLTQGQTATYTLVVRNGGPGPTKGTATVTDTLPAGLAYTGFTGTSWSCTAAGQVVTCTSTEEVAAGSDYPALNLTVNVADSVPPTITNAAEVAGGGELNTANNTCLDGATVVQLVDLTIAKSHGQDFRQGQQGAAYTLTVTNNGIDASRSLITVVDTLPEGLVYADFTGTDWTCTYDSATRTVTCTRSVPLPPGAADATTITITVDVADDAAPSVTNEAEVSGGGDYTPDDNQASDDTTVIQVADLVIAKSLNGTLRQGRTAEYLLTVSNVGPGSTEGAVTVTDTMPTGMTVVGYSSADDKWECSFGAPSITCMRTDILAPAPAAPYSQLVVQVLVAHDAPASVMNQAQVSGGGEIKLTNDTATDTANVIQAADLTITKQHHGNLERGRGGVYRLTVTNEGAGPTDAPVTVADTLPAGMTAVRITGPGWTCDSGTLSCTRSDELPPGGSYATIVLAVRVAGDAEPNLVNQATVSGGGESMVDNNTASDPTHIVAPRPGGGGEPEERFVTITAPVAFTREGSVTVSGSANPGADVRVSGRTVSADDDGTWSATVSLLEGPNEITATNGSDSDSVTVTLDTAPPLLTLTASETRTEQERVELTATSEEGVRIAIESQAVARLTVPLAVGENSFSATATDQAGNIARATVTVERVPVTPPPGPPTPPPGPPTPPPGPPVPPVPPAPPGPELPPVPPTGQFSDVDGHWARGAIDRMVDQGVVRGYADNTFRPEAPVSRLEFAVMVARLLKLTPAGQPLQFSDSASIPDWARGDMAASVEAGIITGRPDGTFDPNAPVNRAEVAAILVRAMKFKGIDLAPGTGRFADELPVWARELILSAARYGVVTGYEDGSFRAGNSATRAESVTMLDRLWTLLSQR